MATTVFTGWRKVTPGGCSCCGCDDGWDCDGRGSIFCDCQVCPDCGTFDGHTAGCQSLKDAEDPLEEEVA